MPVITLPDGSIRNYDQPVAASKVAADIGPGLAKAALGVRINGALRDLATVIDKDSKLEIVTEPKGSQKPTADALYLVRHTCAHVMAEAIQQIWPGAQLVYGPPTDEGFYYDIRFPEDATVSSKEFEEIEKHMAAIVAADKPMTRYEMGDAEGLAKLHREGNKYKLDNATRALEGKNPAGIAAAASGAARTVRLSFYATGEPGKDWEDLCMGPHVPSTGRIKAFKIMSLASSYWHGDENSDRLTRVYGTAFLSKDALDAHLKQLEEARERDHRVIGKKMGLFVLDEMVGPGLVLWTPAGAVIRQELQNFISAELKKQGYLQVFTPHIGKLGLYATSGHFPYYKDSQYPPLLDSEWLMSMGSRMSSFGSGLMTVNELMGIIDEGVKEGKLTLDGYLLKPMNCPHHIRIFASQRYSYRDLPIRLAEFGTVYRWEQSGELNGMVRVRGFTQDDAHLFCTEDQLSAELHGCLTLVKTIFTTLNMSDYRVRVGLRDPDSSKYVGKPENWDKAEQACRDAAATLGIPSTSEPGEAAFYGPKIDFVVKDVIGREWQLGTIQVDYNLPERFDLGYVGSDNQLHRPVIIHRAPFGSMERFCGVLIEHFAGSFPVWLSPVQAKVLPISEKHHDYAQTLMTALREAGIRCEIDARNEKIGLKIREAQVGKVPYMLVVGEKEAASGAVSLRTRKGGDQGSIAIEAAVAQIAAAIRSRQLEA